MKDRKECRAAYYRKNKEKERAYAKKYYAKHRDEIRKKLHAPKGMSIRKLKQITTKRTERDAVSREKYYKTYAEEIRERTRKYIAAHKEEYREYWRQRYELIKTKKWWQKPHQNNLSVKNAS
jgi:spore coat protein CotH